MTNKNTGIAFVILCVLVIAGWVAYRQFEKQGDNGKLLVQLSPLHTGTGWGYEIKVDGKPFIHQENIPAIRGRRGFASKEAALRVGNEVLMKLLKGRIPSISPGELTRFGVIKDSL